MDILNKKYNSVDLELAYNLTPDDFIKHGAKGLIGDYHQSIGKILKKIGCLLIHIVFCLNIMKQKIAL